MDYVLRTNALTKSYKGSRALDGLTMNVPKGAIYGFVGKNGAGKTTLIRLICGLQEPDSGDYTLYGIKSTEKDIIRSRRRMGARHLSGSDGGRESEDPVPDSGDALV